MYYSTQILSLQITNFISSRGGLGGKCKTMFKQVFVSSPGGSNPIKYEDEEEEAARFLMLAQRGTSSSSESARFQIPAQNPANRIDEEANWIESQNHDEAMETNDRIGDEDESAWFLTPARNPVLWSRIANETTYLNWEESMDEWMNEWMNEWTFISL